MKRATEVKEIAKGIHQIKYYYLGAADVNTYVIEGKDKALVIDTCYSTTDTIKYVHQVTDKPLIVVNTHGHFDHIGGDAAFGKVYLAKEDWPVAKRHSDKDKLKKLLDHLLEVSEPLKALTSDSEVKEELDKSMEIKLPEFIDLPKEGYFDLGDRKVDIIRTPGHTPGSICLFDEETGILFGGDMICEELVLLGFDYSTSVREYRNSVEKIKKFFKENHGKAFWPAHHQTPSGIDICDRYIDLCDDLISGKLQGKDVDNGLCKGLGAEKNDLTIIYREI